MKGKRVEFVFLSQEDLIQAGVLDMHRCVDVMDQAFTLLGQGDYVMGGPSGNDHGLRLWFPKKPRGPRMPAAGPDRRFMALVAYLGGEFDVCGAKWYGSNSKNPKEYDLPRSILTIILNDPTTGEPLAIMDGNLVSAMRTGAVMGLAAKYLAKKRVRVAGIVAAGVINKTCLLALADVLGELREVKVFDIVEDKRIEFSEEMAESLGIDVHPVTSLEASIRDSDVISCAVSGEKRPYIKNEWVRDGAFLGLSSAAVELEEELCLTSRVVADNWKMHLNWRKEWQELPQEIKGFIPYAFIHSLITEGKMKDENIGELGQEVMKTAESPHRDEKKTIFLSGGMAIEDLAWAYTMYKNAKKKGLGQKLTLWDEPFWL